MACGAAAALTDLVFVAVPFHAMAIAASSFFRARVFTSVASLGVGRSPFDPAQGRL